MMKEKQYFQEIDILKGIGIILIVLIHSVSPHGNYIYITSFILILFLIISGYLFNFEKYKNDIPLFVKTRSKRLLLPYFTCFIMFFIYWLLFVCPFSNNQFPENEILTTFSHMFLGYLYGIGCTNIFESLNEYLIPVGPLWFLPALFVYEFALLWFLKTAKNITPLLQIAFFYCIFLAGIKISNYIFLPWGIDSVAIGMLFVWIGYQIRQKQILEKLELYKYKNIFLLLLTSFWFFTVPLYCCTINNRTYINLHLSIFSASFIVIVLFYLTKNYLIKFKISNIFTFLGQKCLIILCMHVFLRQNIPEHSIIKDYLVFEVLFLILASLAIDTILTKIPYLRKIFQTQM